MYTISILYMILGASQLLTLQQDSLLQGKANRTSMEIRIDTVYIPVPVDTMRFQILSREFAPSQTWWQRNEGTFLGALLAALVAVASVLFTNRLNKRNEGKKQKEKYKTCLQSIRNELDFYCGKLVQVMQDIENLEKNFKGNTGDYKTPSYSLHPAFLERSKIELNSFFEKSEIVSLIGVCHFDLCHISERLNLIKRMFNDPSTSLLKNQDLFNRYFEMARSIEGFSELIQIKAVEFKKAILLLETETKQIKT